MNQSTNYFFFIYYGYEKTVIDSQVITPVRLLKELGIEFKLLFMEKPSVWVSYIWGGARRRRFEQLNDIQHVVLPRIPKNFLWLNNILIFFILAGSILGKKGILIQARGFQASHIILSIKKYFSNIKLICDVRGVESAEYEFSTQLKRGNLNLFQRWWAHRLKTYEIDDAKTADKIFCVSHSLLNRLKQQSPRPDIDWLHVPCAVQTQRFINDFNKRDDIRAELGLTEKLVVVYSGAMGLWHMPLKLVEIFLEILKIEPNAFFLGLTPTPDKLHRFLLGKNVPTDCFKLHSASFDEIHRYLISADMGLLLREDNLLNNYSCPTKFGEYLAAGLHVLTTQSILDINDIIYQEKVGTILTDLNNSPTLTRELAAAISAAKNWNNRSEKSMKTAEKYFSWSQFIPKMEKAYRELSP